MNEFKYEISDILKNKGFETRVYNNAVLAYKVTRDTTVNEVTNAIGGLSNLVANMKTNADPRRWNRRGVMITL